MSLYRCSESALPLELLDVKLDRDDMLLLLLLRLRDRDRDRDHERDRDRDDDGLRDLERLLPLELSERVLFPTRGSPLPGNDLLGGLLRSTAGGAAGTTCTGAGFSTAAGFMTRSPILGLSGTFSGARVACTSAGLLCTLSGRRAGATEGLSGCRADGAAPFPGGTDVFIPGLLPSKSLPPPALASAGPRIGGLVCGGWALGGAGPRDCWLALATSPFVWATAAPSDVGLTPGGLPGPRFRCTSLRALSL